jgi:hypothetical protein
MIKWVQTSRLSIISLSLFETRAGGWRQPRKLNEAFPLVEVEGEDGVGGLEKLEEALDVRRRPPWYPLEERLPARECV